MKCLKSVNPCEEKYFEFLNEKNGKNFKWEIRVINDSLNINIIDTTNVLSSQYQKTYSKNELEKINKFFSLFDDMNSISLEIEKRLKNGNYEFYENDKSIHISLKIDIIGVNEINLDIPIKENKDISITIKQLFKYIKDTEERVKILEKENEEIKKENQIIKKECEEIKKENKEIKNENQEIILKNQKEESQEIQKENQIIKKEYQEIKKENQIIKKEYQEIKECQEIEIKKIYQELDEMINKDLNNFYNDIKNEINNIVLKQTQKIIIPKNKSYIEKINDSYRGQDLIIEEEDFNDNKIEIEIMNEKIEREEFTNTCRFINIDNIGIKNIGNKTFKHLYFVKDEKESSKDIIFYRNDRKNNLNRLCLDGEFNPSKKTIYSFYLKINYPKINHKYDIILYIREEENGPNLSNPLKIIINVKESDEERIKREEEKEKERKRKEEERIKKEQERKQIEEERKQIEEEEKKKINELFDKLNQEFEFDSKEEIVQKIKEFNFNEDKIKEYIKKNNNNIDYQGLNKEEVENLYNELDQEFNLSSIMDKEEVILKIIELRYDRDALNDWIFEKL